MFKRVLPALLWENLMIFIRNIAGEFASICAIQYKNLPPPHEKYGWALSIELISNNPLMKSDKKICLIVDAHLDELDEINRRIKPIIADRYLPINFELVYASADSGSENFSCRMIRHADQAANDLAAFLHKTKKKKLLTGDNG